ncbi:MAG TPA: hypothetical protein PKZ43_04010 [Bacteroidales bacterium]|nr:hypothetical protein [Bacteroidales bacterium]HQI44796.1 hypothetical protein [Bacteroidales bacterium]
MKIIKIKLPLFINIVLITFFLFIFYNQILLSPNSYIIGGSIDALKSVYSSIYHIYDKFSFHFTGTNYPYGENFLFTDCQPVITSLIKISSYVFPSVLSYEVGIINYLLLLSIFFTSIFLYFILVKYNVNRFFAAFCAFFITVLSPQIFRLTAHPFLSYSLSIPLTWFLFMKYNESKKKWKWTVINAINILFWFFIHTYLGMINVFLFLLFYILKYLWNIKKNKKIHLPFTAQIILQYIIPVLIFWIIVSTSDNFTGRSTNPYGFLLFNAEIETVFLPTDEPFKPIIQKFIKIPDQNWEGWSYIGITSDFILLLLFVFVILSFFNKRYKEFLNSVFENKSILILFISSILVLLYSMGFPFILNLQWLADKYPIIKQFRTLGRFAWAFFFVSTIICTYFCWRFYEILKEKKNILRFVFLILPILYFFEGLPYHKKIATESIKTINYFNTKYCPEQFKEGLAKINPEDFQAIIPLPYYCGGSDNFGRGVPDGNQIYLISEVFSFYKQMPIMTQHATRTSIWQAKNLMQLLSPGYYQKNILTDLKSQKKFLIIYSNGSLNDYEQYYFEKSNLIYKNDQYSLCSLDFNTLFENTAKEEITNFNRICHLLKKKNGFLVSDTSSFIYFHDFEEMQNDTSIEGKGAYSGKLKDYNKFGEIPPNTLNTEKEYIASFWMYNNGENYGQDMVSSLAIIQEGEGEGSEWTVVIDPCTSQCINGNWSLVELKFKIKDASHLIAILIKGKDNSKKPIYVDNLLVRESNSIIYKVIEKNNGDITKLFKNNQMILNSDL